MFDVLFNSLEFFAFFAVFYAAYLALHRARRGQNALLLVGSYIFYGWWDWRFLSLLVISTVIDFSVGRAMSRFEEDTDADRTKRKRLLWVSLASNLSILGFFKYFNFFADSFTKVLEAVGFHPDPLTLEIVLPVGISFYTFQTMSYTIDVYRRKLDASRSLLDFAVFVSFFPQLVAGPIERAANLLPQVARRRVIDRDAINAGIFLIIYGYFLKVFVADNVAQITNEVFENYRKMDHLDLTLGVVAFAFQIYGDFAGYSKIARGISRLMGFELMVNFRLPYFALNPSDFWNRWHISLSSWLRDYLYISLGGNRGGAVGTYRNLFLTMLLGGLWHGAAWTFVLWGAFHGTILIIYRLGAELPARVELLGRFMKTHLATVLRWAMMTLFTLYGWLIFRAKTLDQVWHFTVGASIVPSDHSAKYAAALAFYCLPLIAFEVIQHFTKDLLVVTRWPWPVRAVIYGFLVAITLGFGQRESVEFIYFQF